jgi:hypothetical protein
VTGSFLARHRTICAVLAEIKFITKHPDINCLANIDKLCDEAIDYAQRMSAKLVEYSKMNENTHDK